MSHSETSGISTHTLGYPRIGAGRELKFALEAYWKGASTRDELKAAERIPSERLWVNPDCGLKTRQWKEVIPALKQMIEAARLLRVDGGTLGMHANTN